MYLISRPDSAVPLRVAIVSPVMRVSEPQEPQRPTGGERTKGAEEDEGEEEGGDKVSTEVYGRRTLQRTGG